MESFIQQIDIKHIRSIENLTIPLDVQQRKHLIITGKNGVGKTTILDAIDNVFNQLINNVFAQINQYKRDMDSLNQSIQNFKINIQSYENNILIQKQYQDALRTDENYKVQFEQFENNIRSYQSNILNEKSNIESYKNSIKHYQEQIDAYEKSLSLKFSNNSEIYEDIVSGKFILALFKAKRENKPNVPNSIQNIPLSQKYNTDTQSLHTQFIAYMTKLRMDMLDAEKEKDLVESQKIEQWFFNFEASLKELFQEPALKLVYHRKELNFKIEYHGKSFGLNELSDGYSSLLAIVTELILRMEAHNVKAYDMQGIVLIDEIETHLHVELQKKVLPFLVGFFPKIQFIVTTHSPFVLSSLSNAIICDLEKKVVTSDLSAYSYDALVESYFDSDKYSSEIKEKIKIFEELSQKSELKGIEKDEYMEIKRFFKTLPTFRADELAVKIKEILRKDVHKG